MKNNSCRISPFMIHRSDHAVLRLLLLMLLLLLLTLSNHHHHPCATHAFSTTTISSSIRRANNNNSRSSNPYVPSLSFSSTRLYHMGHSHDHHAHHASSSTTTTTTGKSSSLTPKQKLRRRIIIFVICWCATCGISLLRFQGRRLQKSDWYTFGITSITLCSADRIRKSFQSQFDKLNQFKNQIVKHAPQQQQQSTTTATNGGNDTTTTTTTTTASNHQQQDVQQQQQKQQQQNAREADRVTWFGVGINLILSIGKLFFGMTQHSSALIADAGHSVSDLISDFITLLTVNIARLPADEDHPYGHWKFEAIGSLFLSLTLMATAISIGTMANKKLLVTLSTSSTASTASTSMIPGKLALVMAAISIASKEWLYRITKHVGERIHSQVVIANAWHHRSDAYSSVLALCSIAWARTGVLAADAAAGMLVAGMIGMTGFEILMESIQQLSDGANPSLQNQCEDDCQTVFQNNPDDVEQITSIKARQVGSLSMVEVQLTCPMHLSTTAARAVEERWTYWLKDQYGYEATVHAKPDIVLSTATTAPPEMKKNNNNNNNNGHQQGDPQQQQQQGQQQTSEELDNTDAVVANDDDDNNNNTTTTTTTTTTIASTTSSSDAATTATATAMSNSAGSIEQLTRQQALLSLCSTTGGQVDRVTVHYHAGYQTSVDVVVVMPPPQQQPQEEPQQQQQQQEQNSFNLRQLMQQGQKLRNDLLELDEIDNANIYWDLTASSTYDATDMDNTATNSSSIMEDNDDDNTPQTATTTTSTAETTSIANHPQ